MIGKGTPECLEQEIAVHCEKARRCEHLPGFVPLKNNSENTGRNRKYNAGSASLEYTRRENDCQGDTSQAQALLKRVKKSVAEKEHSGVEKHHQRTSSNHVLYSLIGPAEIPLRRAAITGHTFLVIFAALASAIWTNPAQPVTCSRTWNRDSSRTRNAPQTIPINP